MSSYQGSTSVRADAKAVFDYVSNPENLPQFVPHIQHADCGFGDVLHISGECPHGAFRGVGGFIVDAEELQMHWDSRANLNYRGWLRVTEHGEESSVTVHLEFNPGLDSSSNKDFIHVLREHPQAVQAALDEALSRIKSHCERSLTTA